MSLRMRKLVTAAVGVVFTATCTLQDSPVQPSPGLTNANLSSSVEAAPVSEQLELRLAFQEPGSSRLAPSTTVEGPNFTLHLDQAFDPETRTVALEASVQNRSLDNVWRPIRLTVARLLPNTAALLTADNHEPGIGAAWDYGQTTGLDGKLVPGETSAPRSVWIRMPGQDEASLHSLRVLVTLEGVRNPAFVPAPARDATAAEAAAGFGAGIVLIRYQAGILDPGALAAVNLEFGLAGQEYEPSLGGYIAFTMDPGFDATRTAAERLGENPAVALATVAFVAVPLALDFPTDGEIGYALELGNFRTAWTLDRNAGRLSGAGVVVGVLDSGIDPDGLEFQDQRAAAVDARLSTPDGSDPDDHFGHGTEVAGVIAAAANGDLVVGGAYGAKIFSIKIYDQKADFGTALWPWNILRGLDTVLQHPEIAIINISWGQHCVDGGLCSIGTT